MLNRVVLEQDGLVVGGNQLVTSGGSVNVANNIYIGGNTVTGNLTVTGTFNYPRSNTGLPTFSAWGSTLVSATNTTNTQIIYDRIEYDTNNCYNPTNQWLYVNGIYTPPWSWAPNVPGYYMIIAPIGTTPAGSGTVTSSIYRQNNLMGQQIIPFSSSTNPTAVATTILPMNGVSDYISVFGVQTSGGTLSIGSNVPWLRFTGCFLRPL